MTADDMERVRDAFVAAAKRALRAGIDAIELHGAHGYLLHSFVSPLSNKRTDAYGGSLAARMRYPLEIAQAVRAVMPTGTRNIINANNVMKPTMATASVSIAKLTRRA